MAESSQPLRHHHAGGFYSGIFFFLSSLTGSRRFVGSGLSCAGFLRIAFLPNSGSAGGVIASPSYSAHSRVAQQHPLFACRLDPRPVSFFRLNSFSSNFSLSLSSGRISPFPQTSQSGFTFKNFAAASAFEDSMCFVLPENQSLTDGGFIPHAAANAFFVTFGGPLIAICNLSDNVDIVRKS